MWHFVAASVAGTSHTIDSVPCQDAAEGRIVEHGGQNFFLAVCSDGAGSATHAQIGSTKAVAVGLDIVGAFVSENGLDDVNRDVVLSWFSEIRKALQQEAAQLAIELADLHCTLLMAVLGTDKSLFAQVGDGAMVIERGATLEIVFWPQSGEFTNANYFLTTADLASQVEIAILPESPDQLAVFTDGLERLVLNFAAKCPHEPFFRQMFSAMFATQDPSRLKENLCSFLSSERVNDRTDDDKTLVLAVRIGKTADTPGDPSLAVQWIEDSGIQPLPSDS